MLQNPDVTMRPITVEDGGQLLGFSLVMQERPCLKYPGETLARVLLDTVVC